MKNLPKKRIGMSLFGVVICAISVGIFKTHRMSSCRFCDRIIVIADKTIKESGTHDELIAKGGIYKELFSTQAKWYGERIFG